MKEREPGFPYMLSQEERQFCLYVAHQRELIAEKNGLKNKLIDKTRRSFLRHVEGFAGELVLSRFLRVEANPILDASQVKGSIDFVNYDNLKIEAKTTDLQDGKLIANVKKTRLDHSDVYFLITGDTVSWFYQIRGWAWASDFIRPENIEMMQTEVYALRQDQLQTIRKWRNIEGYHDSI